jgi:hypothetical protein
MHDADPALAFSDSSSAFRLLFCDPTLDAVPQSRFSSLGILPTMKSRTEWVFSIQIKYTPKTFLRLPASSVSFDLGFFSSYDLTSDIGLIAVPSCDVPSGLFEGLVWSAPQRGRTGSGKAASSSNLFLFLQHRHRRPNSFPSTRTTFQDPLEL